MTYPVDLAKLVRAIETEFERTGSPEQAAGEKRNLKSDKDFLGATLADIRRVARRWWLTNDSLVAQTKWLRSYGRSTSAGQRSRLA